MSVETAVYSLLSGATSVTSIVSTRIYPTDATEGTDWPFLVYRADATNPVQSMSGLTALTMFTLTIDVFARSVAQRQALSDALKALLGSYRGGNISGSFYRTEDAETLSDETEGDIYHSTLTFDVWFTGAAIPVSVGNQGSVTTGANSITLGVCSHNLTLNCSGLSFDGTEVGTITSQTPTDQQGYLFADGGFVAGVDLLNDPNTWGAVQTFTTPSGLTLTVGATGTDLDVSHTSTSQVRHLKLNNTDAGGAGGMISGFQGTNEILRLGWHFDGVNWVGSLGLIGSIALMNCRAIGSNVRVSYGPTDLTGSVASQLTIQPGSASDAGLVIRGAASQSASLFAVQDSTGVARMYFDLNNYALVVANTTIALFSLTVPENYDIRAASFLDFTITNPTLRWPTSSPNVGLKYSGTAGTVKVTDGSTGKGSVSAKAYETQSGSADPTTTDIPSGYGVLWKNTTSGTLKLWANDGGTMKSVALT